MTPVRRQRPRRRQSTRAAHEEAVNRVIEAMHERLAEPFLLQEMADIALLSPCYFNRIFRRTTGFTPGQFLTALRVEAAKQLLLQTDMTVTEVCFAVGYSSVGSFSSQFAQLVGLPPSRLRRLRSLILQEQLAKIIRERRPRPPASTPAITGTVRGPAVEGLTLVALFSSPIPEGEPASCTLLEGAGPYRLRMVADGIYHLFAASLPSCELLWESRQQGSDSGALWVGAGEEPIVVANGRASGTGELSLRPLRRTDPPILVDILYLLTRSSLRNDATAIERIG